MDDLDSNWRIAKHIYVDSGMFSAPEEIPFEPLRDSIGSIIKKTYPTHIDVHPSDTFTLKISGTAKSMLKKDEGTIVDIRIILSITLIKKR